MYTPKHLAQNVLIGSTAALFAGAHFVPSHQSGPVLAAATSLVTGKAAPAVTTTAAQPMLRLASAAAASGAKSMSAVETALEAFSSLVRPLSHPQALASAFQSYFAFKSAHPN